MTNELRILANGHPCCSLNDAAGVPRRPPRERMCDECRAHFHGSARDETSKEDRFAENENAYPIADAYAPALAELRAAAAKPGSFAERYAAERLAALAETRSYLDANVIEFHEASDEQPVTFPPPDAYAAGLRSLRESEARR